MGSFPSLAHSRPCGMGSGDDVLAPSAVGENSMIAILMTPLGRGALVVAGILTFLGLFAFDQQSRGASKAVAKIDKANTHAVHQANSVRDRSRSGSGSVLDPNTLVENLSP